MLQQNHCVAKVSLTHNKSLKVVRCAHWTRRCAARPLACRNIIYGAVPKFEVHGGEKLTLSLVKNNSEENASCDLAR
jgi:hypothetical protein